MGLCFQSLASGSNGNCLSLWNREVSLLVDFGLGSMKKSRGVLEAAAGGKGEVDAVLVTHIHSDHIRSYPLRVLCERDIPVRVHEGSVKALAERHFRGRIADSVNLKTFSNEAFRVGDMVVEPFQVPHHPSLHTCGFVIRCQVEGRWVKAVIASDFNSFHGRGGHFMDADFIYVESNHDPGLLRMHPNFNSRFHMSNPNASELLYLTCKHSRQPPGTVVLGHLSQERNEPELAIREVHEAFSSRGARVEFNLRVASRNRPSEPVSILP